MFFEIVLILLKLRESEEIVFNETLVIALVDVQDRVLASTEQSAISSIDLASRAISAAQADDRIDVVVVASDSEQVLALAHASDTVNHRLSGGALNSSEVVLDVLESPETLVEAAARILYLKPNAPSGSLSELIDEVFTFSSSSVGSPAVTVKSQYAEARLVEVGRILSERTIEIEALVKTID